MVRAYLYLRKQREVSTINNLWGYESPSSNKMYGLIGLWDGTSFVEITDSRHPIVLGFLEQSGELPRGNCDDEFWRDIKVVNDIAYWS